MSSNKFGKTRRPKRSEMRAAQWVAERSPMGTNKKRSIIKDVNPGTCIVKREVNFEASSPLLFDAIDHLKEVHPSLKFMAHLSVSIISPRDGVDLQRSSREANGNLHLADIKDFVDKNLSYELAVNIGNRACFGVKKHQTGKRYLGYHLLDPDSTLVAERTMIVSNSGSPELAKRIRPPHISIASTKDQHCVEEALRTMTQLDVRGEEIVLNPAEMIYTYYRAGVEK